MIKLDCSESDKPIIILNTKREKHIPYDLPILRKPHFILLKLPSSIDFSNPAILITPIQSY